MKNKQIYQSDQKLREINLRLNEINNTRKRELLVE